MVMSEASRDVQICDTVIALAPRLFVEGTSKAVRKHHTTGWPSFIQAPLPKTPGCRGMGSSGYTFPVLTRPGLVLLGNPGYGPSLGWPYFLNPRSEPTVWSRVRQTAGERHTFLECSLPWVLWHGPLAQGERYQLPLAGWEAEALSELQFELGPIRWLQAVPRTFQFVLLWSRHIWGVELSKVLKLQVIW